MTDLATLRDIFDTLPVGILLLTPEGRIREANPAAQAILGLTPDELLGRDPHHPSWQALREDGRPLAAHEFPGAICLREQRPIDNMVIGVSSPRHGQRRWLQVNARPFYADGHLAGAYTSFIDISERHTAALALRESESRYRSLVESSPDAIYVVADHRIVMVNRACVTLFAAHSPDDLLGRNPLSLVPAPYQPLIRHRLKRALIDGLANPSIEIMIQRCDGSLLAVDGVSVPFDHQGRRALQEMLRDATPRKRMEALLRQRGEETERSLAWEVAQQTVGGIAHEMNQPLNAITTLGEAALRLLQRSSDVPPRLEESVTGMVAGAQRAGRVLHELMYFLKRPDMHRQALDLDALICHAIEQIHATQSFPGLIDYDDSTGLPAASGNQAQIEKVLLNLLRNAVEACADRPDALIRVGARQENDHLCVSICDNGPGVAADFAPRLFQPFATTKPGGIGMGLPISHALVKSQGGRLWYDPAPGGGACFSFCLPRAGSHPNETQP